MDRLLIIKLDNGSTFEAKAPDGVAVKLHDTCVFRRDFYTDSGEVVREITDPPAETAWSELPTIQHVADNRELATANDITILANAPEVRLRISTAASVASGKNRKQITQTTSEVSRNAR